MNVSLNTFVRNVIHYFQGVQLFVLQDAEETQKDKMKNTWMDCLKYPWKHCIVV